MLILSPDEIRSAELFAAKNGKKCLVIDKRSHIGGNIYTENENGGVTAHLLLPVKEEEA